MCLAQGHNAVTPVRLEPAATLSRVKHSTTEPLRSLVDPCDRMCGDAARSPQMKYNIQNEK